MVAVRGRRQAVQRGRITGDAHQRARRDRPQPPGHRNRRTARRRVHEVVADADRARQVDRCAIHQERVRPRLGRCAGEVDGAQLAARAVGPVHDLDLDAVLDQPVRGREPGDSGTHHDDPHGPHHARSPGSPRRRWGTDAVPHRCPMVVG